MKVDLVIWIIMGIPLNPFEYLHILFFACCVESTEMIEYLQEIIKEAIEGEHV